MIGGRHADDQPIDDSGRQHRRDDSGAALDQQRRRARLPAERPAPPARSTPSGPASTTSTRTPRSANAARRSAGALGVVITIVVCVGVEDARRHRESQLRVEHDPQRRGAGDHAHRQLRVVLDDGADADEHPSQAARSAWDTRRSALAADPLGVAGGGGDATVKRLGVLQHHVGPVAAGRGWRRAARWRRRGRVASTVDLVEAGPPGRTVAEPALPWSAGTDWLRGAGRWPAARPR